MQRAGINTGIRPLTLVGRWKSGEQAMLTRGGAGRSDDVGNLPVFYLSCSSPGLWSCAVGVAGGPWPLYPRYAVPGASNAPGRVNFTVCVPVGVSARGAMGAARRQPGYVFDLCRRPPGVGCR